MLLMFHLNKVVLTIIVRFLAVIKIKNDPFLSN